MIQVSHLTKYYGDFLAVNDLSFEIQVGHVYGFLGPNGAGKSTTMNIMTGCLSPTDGTVKIGGTSTNNIDVWNFADETEDDQKNKGLQEATSNVYGNGHTSLFADMMDAIEHDRKPYVDAVAGRNALEMILAIYQSAATGKPVKLPLSHVASTDFTGRFDK